MRSLLAIGDRRPRHTGGGAIDGIGCTGIGGITDRRRRHAGGSGIDDDPVRHAKRAGRRFGALGYDRLLRVHGAEACHGTATRYARGGPRSLSDHLVTAGTDPSALVAPADQPRVGSLRTLTRRRPSLPLRLAGLVLLLGALTALAIGVAVMVVVIILSAAAG